LICKANVFILYSTAPLNKTNVAKSSLRSEDAHQ